LIQVMPLPEHAWDAWSPEELSLRLGSRRDWYVVGGWALDLWHGYQTRRHEDLEFAVLPERLPDYRESLSELEFFAARSGTLTHLSSTATVPADIWQLWGADIGAGCWRVEMMLERGAPDVWVYKRESSLQMPRSAAIRTSASGISYLAPAIVLLFKAKQCREKDTQDFHSALTDLLPSERADLRWWLEKLHPGHGWLTALR
jgi:hypothetical protein